MNTRHGFCNIRIFEYICCFCVYWPFEFSYSNLSQRPNSFNSFWKDMNFLFLSFCQFSGIVLHRVHKKFEVVFLIYGLWLTILCTFSKDFTKNCWTLHAINTFVWPKGKQLLQKHGNAYNSRNESETGTSYFVTSRNIKQTVLNHWSTIISCSYILDATSLKMIHSDTTWFQLLVWKLIARIVYENDSKLPRPILWSIIKMNK